MPASMIKSFAQKSGKSEAEVEKLWKEAKKAAGETYSEKDDKYYGTATMILKRKLNISESRMSFADYVNPKPLNEETKKFNDYISMDAKDLALIELFSSKKKIKDHKDFHKLAEDLGLKEASELEERAYAMLQSFWSNGRAMEKGMKFKVDEKEVKMGIKVEYEHTDSEVMAYRIALDHLAEMDDYYTQLAKMEKSGGVKD